MTREPLTKTFTLEGIEHDDELQAIKIIGEVLSELYGEYGRSEVCNRVIDYISSKYKDLD